MLDVVTLTAVDECFTLLSVKLKFARKFYRKSIRNFQGNTIQNPGSKVRTTGMLIERTPKEHCVVLIQDKLDDVNNPLNISCAPYSKNRSFQRDCENCKKIIETMAFQNHMYDLHSQTIFSVNLQWQTLSQVHILSDMLVLVE